VRFGGVLAVNNVSFDVRRGEVFTLIGPNGAGKTTVFNLISRIYTPTSGSIDYAGPRPVAHRAGAAPDRRAGHCAHLPEHRAVRARQRAAQPADRAPHAPPDGLWSELLFTPATRAPSCRARAGREVIELLDLQHYRDAGGRPALRRAQGGGAGARAVHRAALLLLDEPSSGLNVEETDDMAFWIQDIQHELGITVLMVEHDMGLVSRVSDRVLALNQGEVLAMGTPAEVQADARVAEAYLGRSRTCPRCGGRHEHGDPAAGQRRKRLRPHQGHPRRQPAGGAGRDRHRAGQQRRGQDHHPQDHLGHHRPAQGQRAVQGPGHHRPRPGLHRAAGLSHVPEGREVFPCCRCATTC
jgi:branched-chain amino acid transport system ATP-binding protein